MTLRRRLLAFVTVTALVGASLTLALVIPARSAHALSNDDNPGTITYEFCGRLENGFAPITQPPPSLILSDSGSGTATVLGQVTDSFTVNIDFSHPIANNFFLVSKTGSLFAADGDRVDLAMVGTFNAVTFDVHYVFVVTGGTGRFAGATGDGTWHVPPPTVFNPTTGVGSGSEFFDGTLTLPE
jgi:hypothetical protein